MIDLLVWLGTVSVAFIFLRYLPIQMPMKGRMTVWLTGCLISSMAVLATMSYTFWAGVLVVLLLGFVFSMFLQKKGSILFSMGEKETHGTQNKVTVDQPQPKHEEIQESYIVDGNGPDTLDELTEVEKNDHYQEYFDDTEDLHDLHTAPVIDSENESDDESLLELDSAIQQTHEDEEEPLVSEIEDSEHLEEKRSDDKKFDERDALVIEDESLDEWLDLEDELFDQRINEESLVEGEDLKEEEHVTEDELMAERRKIFEFDKKGLTLEPFIEDSKQEQTPLEVEEEINTEDATYSEDNIAREMEPKEESNVERDFPEESLESLDELKMLADIEDDEDSLLLADVSEESVEVDEALRKQLLELMIEKIGYMKDELSPGEYENFIKDHLTEGLPDLEYYTISKYLINHYEEQAKQDELEVFISVLMEKFSAYPIIVQGLEYLSENQSFKFKK